MQTSFGKPWSLGLCLCLIFGWLLFCPQLTLAFDTTQDNQMLLLVNSKHTLDASWQPNDLLDIAKLAPSTKSQMQLRDAAANAYVRMYTAYKAENNLPLNTISGFRSFAVQKQLFYGKVAGRQRSGQSYTTAYNNTLRYTAFPGTSEHQTGLAIDVSSNASLLESFRNTKQGQWLLAHCWEHGFILRYDEDKTALTTIAFEPWHYRYVGLPHSLIMRDNDWVLEEYMEALHALQPEEYLEYTDPTNVDMLYRIYYTTDTQREYEDIVSISSDNCGGYIITCRSLKVEELLTAWSEQARQGLPLLRIAAS